MERTRAAFRARREAIGVSAKDFADYFGVQERAVTRWERGSRYPVPPDDAWDALAKLEERYNSLIDSAVEAALDSEAARVSLVYFHDQDEYDELGRDEGSYRFANAIAREVAFELEQEGLEVSLMFADEADEVLTKTRDVTRETVELRDFQEGVTFTCPVLECYPLDGYGRFLIVDCHGIGRMAMIQADGGEVFTPKQWDDSPEKPDEIADFRWVDSHGSEAFMVDGLPRLF